MGLMMLKRFLIIIYVLVVQNFLWAQSYVNVSGIWLETIDVADLQGEGGSPLNPTYSSAADQISIDIQGRRVNDWILYVKRIDNTWHSDFRLKIRRTSDGTGGGSISGGTSYFNISKKDKNFFTGYKNRLGIDAQLKLKLRANVIDGGMYDTTVIYTITDLGY
jgi:hypothetical protein